MGRNDARPSPMKKGGKFGNYGISARDAAMLGNLRAVKRVTKESGFVDKAAATFVCDTTGQIELMNTIPQGASASQRIGRKVMLKSIQLKGRWVAGTGTVSADCAAILVYDNNPTASLPAVTDFLVTADPLSFNNTVNQDRFRTIRRWDKFFLGNVGTAGQQTSATGYSFDEFVDLSRFSDYMAKAVGTGAIGDIQKGAIYLITVGSQGAGVTAPNLTVAARTRYIDI